MIHIVQLPVGKRERKDADRERRHESEPQSTAQTLHAAFERPHRGRVEQRPEAHEVDSRNGSRNGHGLRRGQPQDAVHDGGREVDRRVQDARTMRRFCAETFRLYR